MSRGGGVLGDRILWVTCPSCSGKFYCEYDLLHSQYNLICPFCQHEFPAKEGAENTE
jgi:uncharacterized protein YbaR (Trm112 family)